MLQYLITYSLVTSLLCFFPILLRHLLLYWVLINISLLCWKYLSKIHKFHPVVFAKCYCNCQLLNCPSKCERRLVFTTERGVSAVVVVSMGWEANQTTVKGEVKNPHSLPEDDDKGWILLWCYSAVQAMCGGRHHSLPFQESSHRGERTQTNRSRNRDCSVSIALN